MIYKKQIVKNQCKNFKKQKKIRKNRLVKVYSTLKYQIYLREKENQLL